MKELLYNWMLGILDAPLKNHNYKTIINLTQDAINNGESEIKSTIQINNEEYEFKIRLKKKNNAIDENTLLLNKEYK